MLEIRASYIPEQLLDLLLCILIFVLACLKLQIKQQLVAKMETGSSELFEAAVKYIREKSSSFETSDLLYLYARYKQVILLNIFWFER